MRSLCLRKPSPTGARIRRKTYPTKCLGAPGKLPEKKTMNAFQKKKKTHQSAALSHIASLVICFLTTTPFMTKSLAQSPSALKGSSPNPTSPLYSQSGTAILLKDPFGGHYEKVIKTACSSPHLGDTLQIPNFRGKKQGTAPWCWAAAASMMIYHKGIDQNPCQVVSRTLQKDCCSWRSKLLGDWKCWKGGSVQKALAAYGIPNSSAQGSLPALFQKILQELQLGRPVTLILQNLQFRGRPGEHPLHAVVAYGAKNLPPSAKPTELILFDPINGVHSVSEAGLSEYKNDWEKDSPLFELSSIILIKPA